MIKEHDLHELVLVETEVYKTDHQKLMDAYARINEKIDAILEKRRIRKLG